MSLASEDPSFSAEEAVRVQRAMRAELGLGPERFPLPAFVGMISDEIEQLRQAGQTDADIVRLIAASIDRTIAPEDLARFFASQEARHGHER